MGEIITGTGTLSLQTRAAGIEVYIAFLIPMPMCCAPSQSNGGNNPSHPLARPEGADSGHVALPA